MNNKNDSYAATKNFDSPARGLRHQSRNSTGVILLSVLVFALVFCLSFIIPFGFLSSQLVQENGSHNSAQKERKSSGARAMSLEDRIRAAENRELEVPDSLLVDPYDGTCLGKNRIQHLQSDELNDPSGESEETSCAGGNEGSSVD